MIFIYLATLFAIIAFICIFFALLGVKKQERNYTMIKANYQTLKMQYDILERAKDVADAEIKQLKDQLYAERLITKNSNAKTIEDLPKTEKVAKPRGRKPSKK